MIVMVVPVLIPNSSRIVLGLPPRPRILVILPLTDRKNDTNVYQVPVIASCTVPVFSIPNLGLPRKLLKNNYEG